MTGIQNAAFWQKKGTQSETTYNTFLYLCVGRGGGGGRAEGSSALLLTFVINGIMAELHVPLNTFRKSPFCPLTRVITAASCHCNIPCSAAAVRGNFMAQPDTSRNCITKAFAHQVISHCIFHSTFTVIRCLQQ